MESDADDVTVTKDTTTTSSSCRVSIGDSRASSPSGDKSVDVSRGDFTRSSQSGVSVSGRLSNRDSVELMAVDSRRAGRGRKRSSCGCCLRRVCGYNESSSSGWTWCSRRIPCGGLALVLVGVVLVILLTAIVGVVLGLMLPSSGIFRTEPQQASRASEGTQTNQSRKVTISGHVTVIENAFHSFLSSSSHVMSLPSELVNEICLPNNFVVHSFEFQLQQLLKHCQMGQLESAKAIINESDSLYLSQAVFELTFDDGYRSVPLQVHSRDGATDLLADVRRLLTEAAADGNFGIFVLDVNSLNLKMEIAPVSDHGTSLSVPTTSVSTPGLKWVCYNLQSASHRSCYPNVLGHETLPEAETQVAGFLSLLYQTAGSASTCSEHLSEFTCQLYLPQCTATGKPLSPCRSYCQVIVSECPDVQRLINNVTQNCDLLPDSNDSSLCISYPHNDVRDNCRPVEQDECRLRGYTSTSFPNSIGHGGPRTAAHDWNKMVYIDKAVHCSQHLVDFSCAIVYPKCSGSAGPTRTLNSVGPCRSMCEVVKRDCGFFLSMAGLQHITSLNCSGLPQSSNSSVCIGGHIDSTDPLQQNSKCAVDEFACDQNDSFRCISADWVCDGRSDCDNGADERECATCPSGGRVCGNGWCLPAEAVCNGVANCRNMHDERSCLKSSTDPTEDGGADNVESFVELFDAAKSTWLKVCLDETVWSDAMQNNFCLTPPFIPSNSSLGIVTEHYQLLQFLRNRSDCTRYSPAKISCNYTECFAQSTSRLLLQTASTAPSRDLFIEAPDWPWMASLHGGPHLIFFCGASIIDAHWLLTAAHCVGSLTAEDQWTVMGGHSRRVSYDVDRQVRSVVRVIVHPEFSAYAMHNDIALLRVDHPFKFGSDLQPLCLPPSDYSPPEGTRCYIGGWGKNSHRDPGYSLQARLRALTVFSRTSCERNYIANPLLVDVTNDDRLFCTVGKPGIDVCHGDSGSAVMCESDDDVDNMTSSSSLFPARSQLVLAGVVSYGFDSDCGIPDIPSAHTAVPAYITWIRDVIASTGSGTQGDYVTSSPPTVITAESAETVTKVRDGR